MLVNWGPLAVTVDAVSWQDYLGGIIQYHCSSGRANHAVLITGFDRTGAFPWTELQPSRFCGFFPLTCNLPPVEQVIKIQNWVFCWELFGLVSHQFWKCSLIPGEKLFFVLLQFCGTSCPCKVKNVAICVFMLGEDNTGILALSSMWTTIGFTVLYHQTIRNYKILKW